ncbi:hypothetical protein SK128_000058, partial [Halocaridina rubra]
YSFVSMYLVYSLTSLADLTSQVVLLSGVTHRIAQLVECLLKLQCDWDLSSLQASSSFTNITQQRRKSRSDQDGSSSANSCLIEEERLNEAEICGEDSAPIEYAYILSDVTILAPGSSKYLVK